MKQNLFCFLFLILLNLFYYAPSTTASPIINGLRTDGQRFKFHVSIQHKRSPRHNYDHVCGGSIISERYILTAAHCFIDILNGVTKEIFFSRGRAKIIAGTNLRNGPGIERDLIRVFIPSDYNMYTNAFLAVADIAVAELSADLGVHQDPARLAIIPLEALDPHSNEGVHQEATFCGFGPNVLVRQRDGQNCPKASSSTISRFMDVYILGRNECPRFNTVICARNSNKRIFRTACFGDSGAGLVYHNKLVGVLSSGPPDCNTLGPISFTRIYAFMRFIEEALNPRGDHSKMMILEKPEPPFPHDGSSSSSAGDKKKRFWFFWAKNYRTRPEQHTRLPEHR